MDWAYREISSGGGGVSYTWGQVLWGHHVAFTASLPGLISLHQRDVSPMRQSDVFIHPYTL